MVNYIRTEGHLDFTLVGEGVKKTSLETEARLENFLLDQKTEHRL